MISLVGNTPMIRLNSIPETLGCNCHIYAKCEFMNPTGSVSDRTMKQVLLKYTKTARGQKGFSADIIIGGPGDSCLGTAWMSAVGELKSTVIPEKSATQEKLELIKAIESRIVSRTGKEEGDPSSIHPGSLHSVTNEVVHLVPPHAQIKFGITPSSLLCHYNTTGREIKSQVNRKIDMLVCGAEAGGMIFGINMQVREQPEIQLMISVGVDFRENSFCESSQNEFVVPEWSSSTFGSSLTATAFQNKTVTKWYTASDADSYFMARRLAREEGLMVSPPAGAVLSAALEAIEDFGLKNTEGAVVVVVFNGSLWKGPSEFISNSWMLKKNYFEDRRMESLYWWWEMPVSNIKMDPMVLLPVTSTFEIALSVLEKAEVTRGIVLNALDKPVGVLASGSLKSLLAKNLVTLSDTLLGTYCSRYKKIDCCARISVLHPVLQEVPYALLVQKSLTLKDEDELPKLIEDVTGIVDQGNLTKFLLEIEKHHVDNYGIILSDWIPSCDWYKKTEMDGNYSALNV